MAHKHYALPEAKKNMFGRRWREDVAVFVFFFLLAFHFVTSASMSTQALVRQGEQSHVIGFFPIWASDSTMLITNWWEIH